MYIVRGGGGQPRALLLSRNKYSRLVYSLSTVLTLSLPQVENLFVIFYNKLVWLQYIHTPASSDSGFGSGFGVPHSYMPLLVRNSISRSSEIVKYLSIVFRVRHDKLKTIVDVVYDVGFLGGRYKLGHYFTGVEVSICLYQRSC